MNEEKTVKKEKKPNLLMKFISMPPLKIGAFVFATICGGLCFAYSVGWVVKVIVVTGYIIAVSIIFDHALRSMLSNIGSFILSSWVLSLTAIQIEQTSANSIDSVLLAGLGVFFGTLYFATRINKSNVNVWNAFAGCCIFALVYGFGVTTTIPPMLIHILAIIWGIALPSLTYFVITQRKEKKKSTN